MSGADTGLKRLTPDQAPAADPNAHVWLSASAGTGKTQVLTARVFRLLLGGVEPDAILCLTFTKAGAAEMAERINSRLARWVRLPRTELAADLQALGEPSALPDQARARTLFAKVLDAPGGGLRIQTIHSFCQTLLAAFPVEAGLTPGFRALEGREETILQRETLAGMLADAEAAGRERPEAVIGRLSLRLGEDKAEAFLRACAGALPALEALPSGIGPWLRRELDLPQGDIAAYVAERCGALDCEAIQQIGELNGQWPTKSGLSRAETIANWLNAEATGRVEMLDQLHLVWARTDGGLRSFGKGQAPPHPDYAELATALHGECGELLSIGVRGAYADLLADGLEVGREYARTYAAAKRRIGAVDFDDLIGTAVALLKQPGIGDWVRFKLDQSVEHLLIDEAQDTNLPQWAIIDALAGEYFAGSGRPVRRRRTMFTVGDYKQAIFGFQGTDPAFFRWAQRRFTGLAREGLADRSWPEGEGGLPMRELSLVQSFRSTAPVLAFVDAAVAALPDPGMGEIATPEPHRTELGGAGQVVLWPAVQGGGDPDDEERWIDDHVRELARRIAHAVRGWLDDPAFAMRDGARLQPQDVMILVKRRGELASLLVSRLYAEGVPVAGVDRLRLNAPLAVQDLLAAVRFVLQPEDDLSLAALLVSPLLGWTQDELMAAAPRERGSLWRHLQAREPAERLAPLRALLARADLTTPYRLLEEMLSGPLQGRRKLLARLGAEARDPIEELLNAALQFESTTTPSLQRFLDWFDRGEVEIKRDPSAPLNAVRVMTAHAAKGLQAKLVVMADACIDPEKTPRDVLRWTWDAGEAPLPIIRPNAAEASGPLADVVAAAKQRELEEHWRLFYVAATRAEEMLVVAGSLGATAKGPPAQSWYGAAARAMDALGVPASPEARVYDGEGARKPSVAKASTQAAAVASAPVPDWARRRAPEERRPSRPLAPSAIGEDQVADPPPTPAMREAAERGRLLHALFERLPAVAPDRRHAAADRWLRDTGGVADAGARAAIARSVCGVIGDPAFADLFGPDSLAEAPVTAVIEGGLVVAGTVDRLLVTPERVRVVDFKTGRRVPESLAELPDYHLRQMAAYAAALAVIFPDRPIEAGLLYTGGPVLFTLPPDLLARHKPGLPRAEQS